MLSDSRVFALIYIRGHRPTVTKVCIVCFVFNWLPTTILVYVCVGGVIELPIYEFIHQ